MKVDVLISVYAVTECLNLISEANTTENKTNTFFQQINKYHYQWVSLEQPVSERKTFHPLETMQWRCCGMMSKNIVPFEKPS